MALGLTYFKTGDQPKFRAILAGLGAGAAGISYGTGFSMARKHLRQPFFLVAATFVTLAQAVFHVHILIVAGIVMAAALLLPVPVKEAFVNGLGALFLMFASLSLLAFGGGSAVVPELQHQSVEVHKWLSEREFVDIYALTRSTPGPQHADGLPAGLPSFRLGRGAGGVGRYVRALQPADSTGLPGLGPVPRGPLAQTGGARPWRPLAVGTLLAAATMIARSADHDAITWGLTVFATLMLDVHSRRHLSHDVHCRPGGVFHRVLTFFCDLYTWPQSHATMAPDRGVAQPGSAHRSGR